MITLRRELEAARSAQARERESRKKEDEDEIRRLRDRCEKLEIEREGLRDSEVREAPLLH